VLFWSCILLGVPSGNGEGREEAQGEKKELPAFKQTTLDEEKYHAVVGHEEDNLLNW
jgi:hypothetical protein